MGEECDSSHKHNKQVVHLNVKSAQSMMLSQFLKRQPWTPSKNWSNNRNNKCKDVILHLQNLPTKIKQTSTMTRKSRSLPWKLKEPSSEGPCGGLVRADHQAHTNANTKTHAQANSHTHPNTCIEPCHLSIRLPIPTAFQAIAKCCRSFVCEIHEGVGSCHLKTPQQ